MKETKKKHGYRSSFFEEKDEVGHVLKNHNTANPGQDTFEDCPVNPSRSALNLFLLFKLIYAGVIYSVMIYKSSMSSGDKICEGLFFVYVDSGMYLYGRFCREDKIKNS